MEKLDVDHYGDQENLCKKIRKLTLLSGSRYFRGGATLGTLRYYGHQALPYKIHLISSTYFDKSNLFTGRRTDDFSSEST